MKKKIFAVAMCALLLAGFACNNTTALTDAAAAPCFIFGDMVGGY